MKTVSIFALLAVISIKTYCQKVSLPINNGKILYEGIVKLPDTSITAEKLHRLAETWIANFFSNSKSVILIDDMKSGSIIGTKSMFYRQPFKSMPPTYLHYTIAIDLRKGAYRYKIYNVLFERDRSQVSLSESYNQYLGDEELTLFLESKKKAASRYEEKFNFADKAVLGTIESLKTQMNEVSADAF